MMVEGGINKFAENTLMGQAFVKDDKFTVEKMLAAKKTKLNAYKVLVVGEGSREAERLAGRSRRDDKERG